MKKKTTYLLKQAASQLPNKFDSIKVQCQSGASSDLDLPTAERSRKKYFSLAASFALQGLELIKGDPEIRGQADYYLVSHMTWLPLCTLDEAEEYLYRLIKGEVSCD